MIPPKMLAMYQKMVHEIFFSKKCVETDGGNAFVQFEMKQHPGKSEDKGCSYKIVPGLAHAY